jgi:MraZ protein
VLRLRGQASAKVDDKGRLKLPTAFIVSMEAFATNKENKGCGYYLTSLDGQSARFYPMNIWEDIETKLSKVPGTNQSKRRFLEVTAYYGFEIDLDFKGRFLISQILRESAQLKGEVVIFGQIDHLVIWNRHLFERRIAVDPLTVNDLALLAEIGI